MLGGLSGSIVGHISISAGFKSRPVYIRRVFHLSLHLITHLAYLVHKSGFKNSNTHNWLVVTITS